MKASGNKVKRLTAVMLASIMAVGILFAGLMSLSSVYGDYDFFSGEFATVNTAAAESNWTGDVGIKGRNKVIDLTDPAKALEFNGLTLTYTIYPCEVLSDLIYVTENQYYWNPMPSQDVMSIMGQYSTGSTHKFKFYSRITGMTEGTLYYQPVTTDQMPTWFKLNFKFVVKPDSRAYGPGAPYSDRDTESARVFEGNETEHVFSAEDIAKCDEQGRLYVLAGSIFYPGAVDYSALSFGDIGINLSDSLFTTDLGISPSKGILSMGYKSRTANFRDFGIEFLVANQVTGKRSLIYCYVRQALDYSLNISNTTIGRGQGRAVRVEDRSFVMQAGTVNDFADRAYMPANYISTHNPASGENDSAVHRSHIIEAKSGGFYTTGQSNTNHNVTMNNLYATYQLGLNTGPGAVTTEAGTGAIYNAVSTGVPEQFDIVVQQHTQQMREIVVPAFTYCNSTNPLCGIVGGRMPPGVTAGSQHLAASWHNDDWFTYTNTSGMGQNGVNGFLFQCISPGCLFFGNTVGSTTLPPPTSGSGPTARYTMSHGYPACTFNTTVHDQYGDDGYSNINSVPFYFYPNTPLNVFADTIDDRPFFLVGGVEDELRLEDFLDTNQLGESAQIENIYAYDKGYMSVALYRAGRNSRIKIRALRDTVVSSPKYIVITVSHIKDGKLYRKLYSKRISIRSTNPNSLVYITQTNLVPEEYTGLSTSTPAEIQSFAASRNFVGTRYETPLTNGPVNYAANSQSKEAIELSSYSNSKTFKVKQTYDESAIISFTVDPDSIAIDKDENDSMYYPSDKNQVVFDDESGKSTQKAREYLDVSFIESSYDPALGAYTEVRVTLKKVRAKTTYYFKVLDTYNGEGYIAVSITCLDFKPEFNTAFVNSFDSSVIGSNPLEIEATNGYLDANGAVAKAQGSSLASYGGFTVKPTADPQYSNVFSNIAFDRDNTVENPNTDYLTVQVHPSSLDLVSQYATVVYPDAPYIDGNNVQREGGQTVLFYAKKRGKIQVTLMISDSYNTDTFAKLQNSGTSHQVYTTLTFTLEIKNTKVSALHTTETNIIRKAQFKMTASDNEAEGVKTFSGSDLGNDFDGDEIIVTGIACQNQSGTGYEIGNIYGQIPTGNWGRPEYIGQNASGVAVGIGHINCSISVDGRLTIKARAKTQKHSGYFGGNASAGHFGLLVRIQDVTSANLNPSDGIWVIIDVTVENSAPVAKHKTGAEALNTNSGIEQTYTVADLAYDIDNIAMPYTVSGGSGGGSVQYRADNVVIVGITNTFTEYISYQILDADGVVLSNNGYTATGAIATNVKGARLKIIPKKWTQGPKDILVEIYDSNYEQNALKTVNLITENGITRKETASVKITIDIKNSAPILRPRTLATDDPYGSQFNPARIYLSQNPNPFEDKNFRTFKDIRTLDRNGNVVSSVAPKPNNTIVNTFRLSPYDLVTDFDLQEDLKAIEQTGTVYKASGYPKINDDIYASSQGQPSPSDAAFGGPVQLIAGMDYLTFVAGSLQVSGNGDGVTEKLDKTVYSRYFANCIALTAKNRTDNDYVSFSVEIADTQGEKIRVYFRVFVINSKPIQLEQNTPGYNNNPAIQIQVNVDDASLFATNAPVKATAYPKVYDITTRGEFSNGEYKPFFRDYDVNPDGSPSDSGVTFSASGIEVVNNKTENGVDMPYTDSRSTNVKAYVQAVLGQGYVLRLEAIKSTMSLVDDKPVRGFVWVGFKVNDNATYQPQLSETMWVKVEVVNSAPVQDVNLTTYVISREIGEAEDKKFRVMVRGTTNERDAENSFNDHTFSTTSSMYPLLIPSIDADKDTIRLGSVEDERLNGTWNLSGTQQDRNPTNDIIEDESLINNYWRFLLTFTTPGTTILTYAVSDGHKTVIMTVEFVLIYVKLNEKYIEKWVDENGNTVPKDDAVRPVYNIYSVPVTLPDSEAVEDIKVFDLYDFISPEDDTDQGLNGPHVIFAQNEAAPDKLPSAYSTLGDADYPYIRTGSTLKAAKSSVYIDEVNAKYVHILGGVNKLDTQTAAPANQRDKQLRYIYIRGLQRTPEPINLYIKFNVFDGNSYGSGSTPVVYSITVKLSVSNSAITTGNTQNIVELTASDSPVKVTTHRTSVDKYNNDPSGNPRPNLIYPTSSETHPNGTKELSFDDDDRYDQHYISVASIYANNSSYSSSTQSGGAYKGVVGNNTAYNNLSVNGKSYTDYFDILVKNADGSYVVLDSNNTLERTYDTQAIYIRGKKKVQNFDIYFLIYDDCDTGRTLDGTPITTSRDFNGSSISYDQIFADEMASDGAKLSGIISRSIMKLSVTVKNDEIRAVQNDVYLEMGLLESRSLYLANLIEDSDMVFGTYLNGTSANFTDGRAKDEVKDSDDNVIGYTTNYNAPNFYDAETLDGDTLGSITNVTDLGGSGITNIINMEPGVGNFPGNSEGGSVEITINKFKKPSGGTADYSLANKFQTIEFKFVKDITRAGNKTVTVQLRFEDSHRPDASACIITFHITIVNRAPTQLILDNNQSELTTDPELSQSELTIELFVGQTVNFDLYSTAIASRYSKTPADGIGGGIQTNDAYRGYIRPAYDYETRQAYGGSADEIILSPLTIYEASSANLAAFKSKYNDKFQIAALTVNNKTEKVISVTAKKSSDTLIPFSFNVSDGLVGGITTVTYYFRVWSTAPEIKADGNSQALTEPIIALGYNQTRTINVSDFVTDKDNTYTRLETDTNGYTDPLTIVAKPLNALNKDYNPDIPVTVFANSANNQSPLVPDESCYGSSPFLMSSFDYQTSQYVYSNNSSNKFFQLTLSSDRKSFSIKVLNVYDSSIRDEAAVQYIKFYVVDGSNCGVLVELKFVIVNETITSKVSNPQSFNDVNLQGAGTSNAVQTINMSDYVFKGSGTNADAEFASENVQYSVEIYEGTEDSGIYSFDYKIAEYAAFGGYTFYGATEVGNTFQNYFSMPATDGLRGGKNISFIPLKRTATGFPILVKVTKSVWTIDTILNTAVLTTVTVSTRLRINIANSGPVAITENQIGTSSGTGYSEIILTAGSSYSVSLFGDSNSLMRDPDGDSLRVDPKLDISLKDGANLAFWDPEAGDGICALSVEYDQTTRMLTFYANHKLDNSEIAATKHLEIKVRDLVPEDTSKQIYSTFYVPITIINSTPEVLQPKFTFTIYSDSPKFVYKDSFGNDANATVGQSIIYLSDLIYDRDMEVAPASETLYEFENSTFKQIFSNSNGLNLFNKSDPTNVICNIKATGDRRLFIVTAKSKIRGAIAADITTYIKDSSGARTLNPVVLSFVIGNSAPVGTTPAPEIDMLGGMEAGTIATARSTYIFFNESDHNSYYKSLSTTDDFGVTTEGEVPEFKPLAADINGDEMYYVSKNSDFSIKNIQVISATEELGDGVNYDTETSEARAERVAKASKIVEISDLPSPLDKTYGKRGFMIRSLPGVYGTAIISVTLTDGPDTKKDNRSAVARFTLNVAHDPEESEVSNYQTIFEMYNRKSVALQPSFFYEYKYLTIGYKFIDGSLRVLNSDGTVKDPEVEDSNAFIRVDRTSGTDKIRAMRKCDEARIQVDLKVGNKVCTMVYKIKVNANNMPVLRPGFETVSRLKDEMRDDGGRGEGIKYLVFTIDEMFFDTEGDKMVFVDTSSSRDMIVDTKINRDDSNESTLITFLCYAGGTSEITIFVQDEVATYEYKLTYVNTDMDPLNFFANILQTIKEYPVFFGIGLLGVALIVIIVLLCIKAVIRKRRLRASMQALLDHEFELEQQYMQLAASQQQFNMLAQPAYMDPGMMIGSGNQAYNNMLLSGGGASTSNDMLQLGTGQSDFDNNNNNNNYNNF